MACDLLVNFNQHRKHTLTKILSQIIILCVFFAFNAPFSSACSKDDPVSARTVQPASPCHSTIDTSSPSSPDISKDNQLLSCIDCCEKCSTHSYNKSLLKSQLHPEFILHLPEKLLAHQNDTYVSLYLKPLTPPPTTWPPAF